MLGVGARQDMERVEDPVSWTPWRLSRTAVLKLFLCEPIAAGDLEKVLVDGRPRDMRRRPELKPDPRPAVAPPFDLGVHILHERLADCRAVPRVPRSPVLLDCLSFGRIPCRPRLGLDFVTFAKLEHPSGGGDVLHGDVRPGHGGFHRFEIWFVVCVQEHGEQGENGNRELAFRPVQDRHGHPNV